MDTSSDIDRPAPDSYGQAGSIDESPGGVRSLARGFRFGKGDGRAMTIESASHPTDLSTWDGSPAALFYFEGKQRFVHLRIDPVVLAGGTSSTPG